MIISERKENFFLPISFVPFSMLGRLKHNHRFGRFGVSEWKEGKFFSPDFLLFFSMLGRLKHNHRFGRFGDFSLFFYPPSLFFPCSHGTDDIVEEE